MDKSDKRQEADHLFHASNIATNAQRNAAIKIAGQRLSDPRKLRETCGFIKRANMWQLRALFERWGEEMPGIFD